MNIKKIVITIIVVAIIIGEIMIYRTTVNASNNINETLNESSLFSTEQSSLYYELEQAVGDVGVPSNSITVNLNATVTINQKEYYRVYNYATKSADLNSKDIKDINNNFSQLVSNPVYVSKDGDILSSVCNKTIQEFNDNLNKLTKQQQYDCLYQIISEYINSYTANNPNFKLLKNKNYEGNLNIVPDIKVDLNNYKNINNMKCYESEIILNSKQVTIYVSLDGYVYLPSKATYEDLFPEASK